MTADYGYLLSLDPTYAGADSGTGVTSSAVTTFLTVGTELSGGNYKSYLGYMSYDFSDLPADTTNVYFQFNLVKSGGYDVGAPITVHVASYDYGLTLTSGDWLNHTALGALTPLVTIDTAALASQEYMIVELPIGGLNLTGVNKFIFYLDVQVSQTLPTTVGTYIVNVSNPVLAVKRAYTDPGSVGSYRSEVTTDIPEVNWYLDEASGTVAVDNSGNSNDGTYVGSPVLNQSSLLASGQGTSVQFGSTEFEDNYVQSDNTFSAGQTFSSGITLECLVNSAPDDITNFYSVPIGFEESQEIDLELYNSRGQSATDGFYFLSSYFSGVINQQWTEFLVGQSGVTHHLLWVSYGDGSPHVLYIDGDAWWYIRPGDPQTWEVPHLTATSNRLYGGGDHYSDSVNGFVDELSYYSHSLTDTRARIHYKAASTSNPNAPSIPDTVGITAAFTFHASRTIASISDTAGITDSLFVPHQYAASPTDTVGITASLSVSTLHSNYSTEVFNDSPVSYFKLDDNSTTNAIDSIARHDGTYGGTPAYQQTRGPTGSQYSAQFGSAFTAQGRVDVPSTAFNPGTGPFTIEAWIKNTANLANNIGQKTVYCCQGSGGEAFMFFGVQSFTSRLYLNIDSSSVFSSAFPNDHAWHHLVLTHDGTSTFKVYLDGTLRETATHTPTGGTLGVSTFSAFAGGPSAGSNGWTGNLDEVAFYHTELSASRIAVHYGVGALTANLANSVDITATFSFQPYRIGLPDTVGITASFTGTAQSFSNYGTVVNADSPTIYYRLGETSGTTAFPAYGHGTNGTYVNSPTLNSTGLLVGDTDKSITISRSASSCMTGGASLPGGTDYGTFAIEGIVRADSFVSSTTQIIFGLRDSSIQFFDNNLFFQYNGSSGFISTSTGIYTTGVTYHIVGEWDGTNANLYVNGVLVRSIAKASGLTLQGTNDGMNAGNSSGAASFNGRVDEIAFYDHHLGQARVSAHYAVAQGQVYLTGDSSDSVGITASFSASSGLILPVITSITPTNGPIAGGTSVNITGTSLSGVTSVLFGASPAASYVVNSTTSITAVSPAHAVGAVDITVVAPAGTSVTSSTDLFTYQSPIPTISTITPDHGPTVGGVEVELAGAQMLTATAVRFGTTDATSFVINSDTSITAVAPAHVAGLVSVTVVNATGSSIPDTFTYNTAPAVNVVTPTGGTTSGGVSVVIAGVLFTGATAVHFGETPALSYTVDSDTQITAIAPPHNPGTVNIRVTTAAGTN